MMLKSPKGSLAVLCALTWLCLSCGSHSNPILGKWTAKDQNSIFVPSDVEFTENEQITGMNHERHRVTYRIEGSIVSVTPQGALPRVCRLTGADTMACDGIGDYVRVK